MKFWEIFKDDNEWNEKTIAGFIALVVVVIIALVDTFTPTKLLINEYVFDGLMFIVIAGLAIGSFSRWAGKKNNKNDKTPS